MCNLPYLFIVGVEEFMMNGGSKIKYKWFNTRIQEGEKKRRDQELTPPRESRIYIMFQQTLYTDEGTIVDYVSDVMDDEI